MTTDNTAPVEAAAPVAPVVANLRETRREQAAARRRHPAGSKKAPAKAAAKKPAKPAGDKPVRLRWEFEQGFENRASTGQRAKVGLDEVAMVPLDGGKWRAVLIKADGSETVLGTDLSHAKAYQACVTYAKGTGK